MASITWTVERAGGVRKSEPRGRAGLQRPHEHPPRRATPFAGVKITDVNTKITDTNTKIKIVQEAENGSTIKVEVGPAVK